jgi:hypothetical protein
VIIYLWHHASVCGTSQRRMLLCGHFLQSSWVGTSPWQCAVQPRWQALLAHRAPLLAVPCNLAVGSWWFAVFLFPYQGVVPVCALPVGASIPRRGGRWWRRAFFEQWASEQL